MVAESRIERFVANVNEKTADMCRFAPDAELRRRLQFQQEIADDPLANPNHRELARVVAGGIQREIDRRRFRTS